MFPERLVMQRVVGLAALGALVAAAYFATLCMEAVRLVAQAPTHVVATLVHRRAHPLRIPDGEVIVGHPRDGIVALPVLRRVVR